MVQRFQGISVEAPGSVVLMGEHGVLYGHGALALAINKILTISLTVRNDRCIKIDSSLGYYQGCLDLPMNHPSFSFIIAAINHLKPSCGLNIKITSKIDHQSGLGSSSAITVAITAALLTLKYQKKPPKDEILRKAHEIVLKVQKNSSGIDLATSIYGGLIFYRMPGYYIEKIETILPIQLIYSGYKTPTSKVLDIISNTENAYPSTKKLHQKLYSIMGELSKMAVQAIRDDDLKALAQAINMQHGLLETLGVSDKKLSEIVWKIREHPDVIAAKISGSGLGDCVITLGKPSTYSMAYQLIDCSMHSKGINIVPLTS